MLSSVFTRGYVDVEINAVTYPFVSIILALFYAFSVTVLGFYAWSWYAWPD